MLTSLQKTKTDMIDYLINQGIPTNNISRNKIANLLSNNPKYLKTINRLAKLRNITSKNVVDDLIWQSTIRSGNYSAWGGQGEPSLNPNFCDGHITQCQDSYNSTCQVQSGGSLSDHELYLQYKYYKKMYKQLKYGYGNR